MNSHGIEIAGIAAITAGIVIAAGFTISTAIRNRRAKRASERLNKPNLHD